MISQFLMPKNLMDLPDFKIVKLAKKTKQSPMVVTKAVTRSEKLQTSDGAIVDGISADIFLVAAFEGPSPIQDHDQEGSASRYVNAMRRQQKEKDRKSSLKLV